MMFRSYSNTSEYFLRDYVAIGDFMLTSLLTFLLTCIRLFVQKETCRYKLTPVS